LVTECLPCHGGKKTENGFKVDSREALMRGGDSGPAIVAGEPDKSTLLRAIQYGDDALRMPPKRRLSADVAAAFRQWISAGAVWPHSTSPAVAAPKSDPSQHWAFRAINAARPPKEPTVGATSAIDNFITGRLSSAGLCAVGRADRRTLIRRVTFDLTGLPPLPEEVDAFENDPSPTAYARVVDRLLASPRYGERWGRHWMDVVRYADTAGDNADYPIPEAALYRDYIIDAFNRDKPFDQFVREQLAGDILAKAGEAESYASSVVATGFLALSRRYATAPFELWHLTLEDTIETTGRAFLGLTLRCARCHDHKFDPVSQRDYYALYGIFASTTFPYAGSEELQSKEFPRLNFVPLVEPAKADPILRKHQQSLKSLEETIRSLESGKDPKSAGRVKELRRELLLRKRPSLPPELPGAYAVAEGPGVNVPLQRRGDPGNPGEVVPRGVPRWAFLEGATSAGPVSSGSGRLELANWIADASNPLTARVIANRIWQHHFGTGIVATASNMGLRGDAPSHPELLDWLAARLIAGGWSIKSLHREILLSQTYQRSSADDARNAAVDPEDRLLWRFPRRRLDAESIRDAMLGVSGCLEQTRPRPHPFPPIDRWHWTQHNAFKEVYPSNHRTVFLMTQRLIKHPYLAIFDGPDTNLSTESRASSTVPLQALYLMNNAFVEAQASGLAKRLLAASALDAERLSLAFRLAWSRSPSPVEEARLREFLRTAAEAMASTDRSRESREQELWTAVAKVMLTANEFLYID
jgi:hypothetical protein